VTAGIDLEGAAHEIRRAVARVCPPWLAHDADDIAQEVLRRVVERQLRGAGIEVRHVSYWRKAAHHALLNEIRRRRLLREERLEDASGACHEHGPGPDPERDAASRELGRAIAESVRRLGDGRRRGVVLFLLGHTLPEAAALLGWQLKRAESAVHRGVRDLRACLTEKGWAP
jgi:RNA polymerase sigma-70 factor (ECF subfamily)